MAQSGARGDMDIRDQKETFDGFIATSVWTSGLIIQTVALLVLSFAIGLGWWPGFFAFVALGVAAGLIFKMPAVYWAVQVATWVLLGVGGMIVPALAGMMG